MKTSAANKSLIIYICIRNEKRMSYLPPTNTKEKYHRKMKNTQKLSPKPHRTYRWIVIENKTQEA